MCNAIQILELYISNGVAQPLNSMIALQKKVFVGQWVEEFPGPLYFITRYKGRLSSP